MTTDEKSEIEEKVADALEENFEKHDVVARAHTGDNTEEDEEDDEVMEGDQDGDQMDTDAEKVDAEAGNLEQAWQMFDLAKVIYGKAGDIAEAHYQLGVAQAHCAEYVNAEKSLAAAVTVLN